MNRPYLLLAINTGEAIGIWIIFQGSSQGRCESQETWDREEN